MQSSEVQTDTKYTIKNGDCEITSSRISCCVWWARPARGLWREYLELVLRIWGYHNCFFTLFELLISTLRFDQKVRQNSNKIFMPEDGIQSTNRTGKKMRKHADGLFDMCIRHNAPMSA